MLQTGFKQNKNNTLDEIAEVIKGLKSLVIVFPEKANVEVVASSLALYLALVKIGKDVYIASSKEVSYKLPGEEKIQRVIDVKGDSLRISFPYRDGMVDRIDWEIKDGKFHIVVIPAEGHPKLDYTKVEFSYTGGEVGAIVVLGTSTLNMLGKLYEENKKVFETEIINIDRSFANTMFGNFNFVNTGYASLSEIIFELMEKLEIKFDPDIATNLYAGLLSATANFTSYNVKPETLEKAASLLRAGARKKIPALSMQGAAVQNTTAGLNPVSSAVASSPRSVSIVNRQDPLNPNSEAGSRSIEIGKMEQPSDLKDNLSDKNLDQQKPPSKDWLRPKIFSGRKINI